MGIDGLRQESAARAAETFRVDGDMDGAFRRPAGLRAELDPLLAEPQPLAADRVAIIAGDANVVRDAFPRLERLAEVDLHRHGEPKVAQAVGGDDGAQGRCGADFHLEGIQRHAGAGFPTDIQLVGLALGILPWLGGQHEILPGGITLHGELEITAGRDSAHRLGKVQLERAIGRQFLTQSAHHLGQGDRAKTGLAGFLLSQPGPFGGDAQAVLLAELQRDIRLKLSPRLIELCDDLSGAVAQFSPGDLGAQADAGNPHDGARIHRLLAFAFRERGHFDAEGQAVSPRKKGAHQQKGQAAEHPCAEGSGLPGFRRRTGPGIGFQLGLCVLHCSPHGS